MIKSIRAVSPVLLTGLFVLISISLLCFYNLPQMGQLRGGSLGKIDGREISSEQFSLSLQAAHESTFLVYGGDSPRNNILEKLAWERLVLLSEARKLGIVVTDKEAADFILHLPILQKEGTFDADLYGRLQKDYLPTRGLTQEHFEQIIKEEVTLEKVREAILSPALVTGAEVDKIMQEEFGPIKLDVVRWQTADYLKEVKVEPADLEKEYKDHATNPDYQTPEGRRVSFVSFFLTPEQMKLADPAKATAKRALGEKATDFAVTVESALEKASSPSDVWESLAKDKGLAPVTTGFFIRDEQTKELPPSIAFNHAAFQLTRDVPISEAVEVDNGYVVIRLVDVKASELRPMDQVKTALEKSVREQGAAEILRKHSEETLAALKASIEKGKSFAAAASELKLSVESPAAFSPQQVPPALKDGESIVQSVLTLPVGQLSPVFPTETGLVLVYVESRSAADPVIASRIRPRAEQELLKQRRAQLMEEWFRERMLRPDISMPKALAEK